MSCYPCHYRFQLVPRNCQFPPAFSFKGLSIHDIIIEGAGVKETVDPIIFLFEELIK